MGPVGVQEMLVIFLVALVLFGPKKLPELGRTIGKAFTEFRRAQSELKATLEHHMGELERENDSIKDITRNFTGEIAGHYEAPYTEPYHAYGVQPEPSPAALPDPSTASASAPEGAEVTVAQGIAADGTVPRAPQAGYPASAPEPGDHSDSARS